MVTSKPVTETDLNNLEVGIGTCRLSNNIIEYPAFFCGNKESDTRYYFIIDINERLYIKLYWSKYKR